MKRDIYIVSVPRVPGVSRARMTAYIKDAVKSWGGGFEPAYEGDPLGPPCILMRRGMVKVWPEKRRR